MIDRSRTSKYRNVIPPPSTHQNYQARTRVWLNEGRIPGCYLFVRLHTDDGLIGLGEAGFSPNPWTVKAYLEDLADQIVGRDPGDIALWDLAGKRVGLPVHRLLGGPVRDRIRVDQEVTTSEDLAVMADNAREVVAQGITAVRIMLPDAMVDAPLDRLVGDEGEERENLRSIFGWPN